MKKTNMVVGAVVLIAIVVIAANYMGYIPGLANILPTVGNTSGDIPETPAPSNEHLLSLSDFEIFSMFQVIFGMDLSYSEISPYITALHMKVYGRDDIDAQTLLEWFESEYAQDGWSSEGTRTQMSTGWTAYHEGWTRANNARMVAIGEGASVTTAFGYDTVYIVSYGPITVYQQFILAVLT